MALWTMILRKMATNKWLQLNLLLGLTVCVALFSSMPLYSGAILQRTLQKELGQLQLQKNVYPGFIRIATSNSAEIMDEKTAEAIQKADQFVRSIPGRAGLPALSFYQQRFTQKFKVYGSDASELEQKTQKSAGAVKSLSDMEQRVRLLAGRMPVDRTDGIIEALVTDSFLLKVKRELGQELTAEVSEQTTLRIIPVGVMATDAAADPYLSYMTETDSDGFIIPFGQFEREFITGGKARVSDMEWRYALDYRALKVEGIDQFVQADKDIRRYFKGRIGAAEINMPANETILSYQGKADKLDVMLLSLYSPVMIMLAFYLYMTANLIIERQKNDIAVLRSRGASRWQIMTAYTLENLLLGFIALTAGPFMGVQFTKGLGAANGFLEFVNRSPLEVGLSGEAYRIAAAAVGAAILLILIPALLATRVSIVNQKRDSVRLSKLSFWHKTGLDVILIGIAVYLLRGFNTRQEDLRKLALDSSALQVDPLVFLMPALFTLGAGLLVLRLYPWFIRFIFWLGRRFWSPALYHTLIQISRSSGQYLTLMLFLIMTVATGLFSAGAARTINDNMESQIRYSAGADLTLQTRWESDAPVVSTTAPSAGGAAPTGDGNSTKRVQYTEPSFQPYRELAGVEAAAKVFRKENARFTAGQKAVSGKTALYGIDTLDFGKTAWMKPGLLEYPINSYLNLIASDSSAVLVSRSLAEAARIKPGDNVSLSWDGLDQVPFTVYGIIDYWPGWSPLPAGGESGTDPESGKPKLIVGHLSSIQNRLAVEPYETWLKLDSSAAGKEVYAQLTEMKLPVTHYRDATQELVLSQNDSFRLAINGIMTLGFVISIMISFFGFLVFWILTLSGRTLQYGVLRAMGISFAQLIGMLISEQLLTSGAAVLIGAGIGSLSSRLFVPLFQMSFAASEQVPPFELVSRFSDYVQLYGILGMMLLSGVLILGHRLSKIRIAQALKLGEE
ncbi:ABC transporter permease [Paenibacillus typhae]|uniref:Putative ABC transport system permease protein n=1 Tax=Paenibacillus typhae TaxID=1174501 RepID=A0A1G8FH19_9BACL|nr:ABC transporter permease [Paenibacillus typhae]SDH81447.1 putative ABC transport system permease protein [Paenibacillus typhae]